MINMIYLRTLKIYGFALIIPLYILCSCKEREFSIDDVAKTQTFIIKKRSLLPYIDPQVTVRVSGHIDGKATICIPNGPTKNDPFYCIEVNKRFLKRELSRAFTYERFSVVYKPITAKSGSIKIEVVAP